MTVTLAEPRCSTLPDLERPRRTGIDFADEAGRAAVAARGRADAARLQAAVSPRGDARRLRREAAVHDLDARCHESAVVVMLSLLVELSD